MAYGNDVLDLRELAEEGRDLLADATSSCTECDGDGTIENEIDGELTTVYCDECNGDGEVFDLSLTDHDRIKALVDLAVELTSTHFDDDTQKGIEDAMDAMNHVGTNYEPVLIAESYFEEYAQDLAESIGAIPSDLAWPLHCIDWERAARELAMDYHSVTFDGSEYLIRTW